MINMEVALVSVIAWFISIAIVLRYCWLGEPNICCAVAAKEGRCVVGHILSMLHLVVLKQLDVGTVALSSLMTLADQFQQGNLPLDLSGFKSHSNELPADLMSAFLDEHGEQRFSSPYTKKLSRK